VKLCALVQKAAKTGFLKEIITQGKDNTRPKKGQKVEVHYVGTFVSGEKFDSSRDKGRTFKFNLGENQVIRGWDEGVATMNIGERCTLVCPYTYAYGKEGIEDVIPPYATLVFDVELLEIL